MMDVMNDIGRSRPLSSSCSRQTVTRWVVDHGMENESARRKREQEQNESTTRNFYIGL